MILSLHMQAKLFLLTILMGGGMGLVYDGLRIFGMPCPINHFGCSWRMDCTARAVS